MKEQKFKVDDVIENETENVIARITELHAQLNNPQKANISFIFIHNEKDTNSNLYFTYYENLHKWKLYEYGVGDEVIINNIGNIRGTIVKAPECMGLCVQPLGGGRLIIDNPRETLILIKSARWTKEHAIKPNYSDDILDATRTLLDDPMMEFEYIEPEQNIVLDKQELPEFIYTKDMIIPFSKDLVIEMYIEEEKVIAIHQIKPKRCWETHYKTAEECQAEFDRLKKMLCKGEEWPISYMQILRDIYKTNGVL